jgi:ABC-type cobalamin/Fe3+-siderophores transport system ATPase subunit
MRDGRIGADAPPEQALTPENLANVFSVEACVGARPDGRPWIFYGR